MCNSNASAALHLNDTRMQGRRCADCGARDAPTRGSRELRLSPNRRPRNEYAPQREDQRPGAWSRPLYASTPSAAYLGMPTIGFWKQQSTSVKKTSHICLLSPQISSVGPCRLQEPCYTWLRKCSRHICSAHYKPATPSQPHGGLRLGEGPVWRQHARRHNRDPDRAAPSRRRAPQGYQHQLGRCRPR